MPKPKVRRNVVVNEVSLCRRGANPGAGVVLRKARRSDADLVRLAKEGKALPDGSLPIEDAADLTAAVAAVETHPDPARARRHVVRRARVLDLTDQLPDTWNPTVPARIIEKVIGLLKGETSDDEENDMDFLKHLQADLRKRVEKLHEADQRLFQAFAPEVLAKTEGPHLDLLKRLEGPADPTEALPDDLRKRYDALPEADQVLFQVFTAETMGKTEGPHLDLLKRLEGPAEDDAGDETALDKSKLDSVVVAHLETLEKNLKAATDTLAEVGDEATALRKERTRDALRERTQRFTVLTKADRGALLESLMDLEEAAREAVLKTYETSQRVHDATAAQLLTEIGGAGATGDGTAYAELSAKAEDLRKTEAGKNFTFEQAFSQVYRDGSNAELVKRYKMEKREAATN